MTWGMLIFTITQALCVLTHTHREFTKGQALLFVCHIIITLPYVICTVKLPLEIKQITEYLNKTCSRIALVKDKDRF